MTEPEPSDAEVHSIANEMRLLANKILDVVYDAVRSDDRIVPSIAAGAIFAAARMVQRQSGLSDENMHQLYEGTAAFNREPACACGDSACN